MCRGLASRQPCDHGRPVDRIVRALATLIAARWRRRAIANLRNSRDPGRGRTRHKSGCKSKRQSAFLSKSYQLRVPSVLGTLKYWNCMDGHRHGEDNEMKTSKRFGQSFVVAREASKAVKPSKAAFNHPSPWQQNEALFRFLQFDHLQINSFITCSLCRILLVGRCHVHGQQLAQRVDRHMNFAATLALVVVITRTWTAFAGRLQCAPVKDPRAGLSPTSLCDPDDRAQHWPCSRKSPSPATAASADTPTSTAESCWAACVTVRPLVPSSARR